MNRLRRYLLPALTCLVVLAAALLPGRLSLLRDQTQLSAVHTEELTVDNDLPLRPLDRLERVCLFARYEAEPEACLVSYRELKDDQELPELWETVSAELKILTDSGVLPQALLPKEPPTLEGTRIYLRNLDSLTGASFLYVGGYDKKSDISCWFAVDEESGRLLAIDLSEPGVRKYMTDPDQLSQAGLTFLNRLDISCELLGASDREALFSLPDTEVSYLVIVDDWLFSIRPCGYGGMASVSETDSG